jgi:carbonic anhydrase
MYNIYFYYKDNIMTCPNATAPVNIVNNPDFVCDLKCEYSFKYPQSGLNIANRGDFLSLKTDASNSPPVTYNANKYEVTEMRLYHPSLHTYSGKKADAELIVVHTNVSAKGNLLVCVPIASGAGAGASGAGAGASDIFDTILAEVAKTATSPGKKTTVNIPTFSIDKLIPIKPYFSYTGTLPYSPCNGEYDYVVFNKDVASLGMSIDAFKVFNKVITANGYSNKNNDNGVFYNKKGPNIKSISAKDDIYMECLPTGSEGETLVPAAKTTEQMFSGETIKDILKNNAFMQVLIGILLIFIITKLGGFLLGNLMSEKSVRSGGGMRRIVSKTT